MQEKTVSVFTESGLITGEETTLEKVQVSPATLNSKKAKPTEAGIPLIVTVNIPEPALRFPAASVATNPVTPVELALCA